MWAQHEQWVNKAIQYMEHHLKEDIEFADVAKHASVSRFHLHRIFQRHIGMSAASYLRERRLACAATELLNSSKRILDIALEYRFAGQDYFTRSFKREYGLTPRAYRNAFRSFRPKNKEDNSMEKLSKNQLPPGWMLTGVYPHQYEIGIDRTTVHRGKASGYIQAGREADASGFGTMMQTFRAGRYQGKRVRLSAFVKTENVDQWCGLWMRIDDNSENPLKFDNMQDRPLTGTTDWNPYHIVLDVPGSAEAIAFGLLLSGSGKAWVDGLRIEEVDLSVPVTAGDETLVEALPDEPLNLDFELEPDNIL
ncbi:transcriptional regulator, AraC family [Paenibacillaceae bacterium GAS479]|nr:transcriptional regulator, AraC family [Paenibacillaceae bacterium GAS479]